MLSDGQSYAVLYDKKLLEFENVDDTDTRYWIDRFIIGMVGIAQYNESTPRINRTYGSDKVKGFLIASMMQMMPNNIISMDDDELKLSQNYLGTGVVKQRVSDEEWPIIGYYVEEDTGVWKQMAQIEKHYRSKYDPYQEWFSRILEWAESIADKETK